jgi:hypothetical protein
MPEFAGAKSGYIGQGHSIKPIRPGSTPGDAVQDLWRSQAGRFKGSRGRILLCRDVRRGLHTIKLSQAWKDANPEAKEWVQALLPERNMIPLNLSNMLASERPSFTRNPRRQTDTAVRQADEVEVWLNAMGRELIDWDELIGKGVEDAEFGVFVGPSLAALDYAPDYMTSIGKDGLREPDKRWDRDERGRKPSDNGYTQRSERSSIAAWRDAVKEHLASTPPFVVRIFPATDCAPILVRGRGKRRFECRGLVTRSLFEREELISRKFRWRGMGDRELIPRGHDSSNTAGRDGQLYLYEAFLISVDDETGEETPFIARSVGGWDTWQDGPDGDEQPATINLREEFGITRLMCSYHWGLHHADDDFDWRGVPILLPLIQTILNVEGLKTSANAHAETNAFTGHVAAPDPNIPETSYLDTEGHFQKFTKPGPDEIVMLPGASQPWAQARVGEDVWRLIADSRASLAINMPDEAQTGGQTDASGHAMVVSHELLESAKRQIKEGGREAYEFIGECLLELACGLARGSWKVLGRMRVNVPAVQDIERVADSGEKTKTAEVIEFNERWVGSNYRVTAEFPRIGNLAEQKMKMDLWAQGGGTFEEMREAFGDMSPETTRLKIVEDAFIQGPIGQMLQTIEILERRKMYPIADMIKQQLAGELTKMGIPTDALAPELKSLAAGTAPGGALPVGGPAGPELPGGMTTLPDMAQNSLAGAVSGEMGIASRQANAEGQLAVNPGQV